MCYSIISPTKSCWNPMRYLLQTCLAAAVGLVGAYAPAPVRAAYTFAKIVDTATTVPGSLSLFTGFSSVAYDGQNIAFIGTSGAGNLPGVYQWGGTQLNK